MCKYRKGEVYYSPVNFRKKDNKKVNGHNVIVSRDTNSDRVTTKLITHSNHHSHKLSETDFKGKWKPDNKSYITKDKFASLLKFGRKRKRTKYVGE